MSARRHALAIVDERRRMLASTVHADARRAPQRAPPSCTTRRSRPPLNGLVLRGAGLRAPRVGLIGNTLFWMVVALAVLTLWMLLGTGRHMRRRSQIQNALLKETQLPPRHGELHASPACGRWTWKAASPTSTPPSAR
jgi:hypothetical protein